MDNVILFLGQYAQYIDVAFNYLVEHFPVASKIFLFMGLARAFMKPLISALRVYVKESPSQADDLIFEKAEKHWAYKAFMYLLDWGFSYKAKKENK